ncbi:MAG: type I-G CRISPR-associated RAMP protein Csb1/Cas7g, partial [Candidatus Dormibacteria bacterium]
MTTAYRQFFDVELKPLAGTRFQPTGFPDLGPALFDRPARRNGMIEWVPALLLESAQSMANHLEAVGWDAAAHKPASALSGLPYVRVVAAEDGRYLTSSRTEAHRLASAFVKDSTLDGKGMREVIRERLGLRDDTPLAPRDIARAVFALDPLCLIHGVFFAESAKIWPGQPRIARAVTSFIEAVDVRAANSGGVKRDEVRHQVGESGGATEGYGFVPYHRTEYTAARIQAAFVLDLVQLRSYGLGDVATEMLATLVRWEVRSLLDGGLRQRTACDLAVVDPEITDREG